MQTRPGVPRATPREKGNGACEPYGPVPSMTANPQVGVSRASSSINISRPELEPRRQLAGAITGFIAADDGIPPRKKRKIRQVPRYLSTYARIQPWFARLWASRWPAIVGAFPGDRPGISRSCVQTPEAGLHR